jgi:hypothetical protein
MKGFIEEITWTVIIWIFLVVIVIIALIHFIIINLGGPGSIKYSVEFADLSNKPYLVAEVLTHYKIEDRQLIEHCIESVVVNSLERADSQNIGDYLKDFMDKYGIKYEITLHNGDELLRIGEEERGSTEAAIPLLYKGIIGYLTVNVK